MKRAYVLGAGVALGLLRPAGAQAQTTPPAPPSFDLAWSAPAGCPDHDAVVARVARLVSRPADAAPARALSIAAHVESGPPWRLRLAIADREAATTRTLEDASCERLADATALMIAIAIDPDADDAGARSAANTAMHPFVIDPERPPRPAPPTMRSAATTSLTLGAALLADVGTLPGFGTGAEVRVGLARRGLRLALRGDAWPARAALTTSRDPMATFGVSLFSVGVQACYVPTRGAFEFRACGALDAGFMSTVAVAAADGQNAGGLWAATYAEVGVAWRVSRWLALRLELGPGVALARPRFVETAPPRPTVFEPALIVGRGAFVVEVNL